MRAMAIVLLSMWGSVWVGMLCMHTPMPIAINVAKTDAENDTLRIVENVYLRTIHALMPHAMATPHHIYNVYIEGDTYCHTMPIMSGMSRRMKGI